MIDATLFVQGLRARVGPFILTADFALRSGERAALVGNNGSGKTSLLRLLAGLDPLAAGSVRLAGEDITRLPPARRKIGYVFQDPALFPNLSVLENVGFGLKMAGVARAERERQARAWLARLGLEKFAAGSVTTLSGGEAQRVAFARALITRPRLLLLDEPFASLDAEQRAELRKMLKDLHAELPVPLLFVSHDAADVEEIATVRLEFKTEKHGGMEVRHVFRGVSP